MILKSIFDKNYKLSLQEFRIYRLSSGQNYFGVKKANYTLNEIGKDYCSIGLWWIEIECYNSLKAKQVSTVR
jgi:hypothetical protein